MRTIPLTQGKFALVDDKDYDWLMQWRWYADKRNKAYYVARTCTESRKNVYMHRQILGATKGQIIDHIDRNGLNCQRKNMRFCTSSDNSCNKIDGKGNAKYKGVSKCSHTNSFCVRINKNRKPIYIGRFRDEIEAAKAYNKAAKIYHGEFAKLNDV